MFVKFLVSSQLTALRLEEKPKKRKARVRGSSAVVSPSLTQRNSDRGDGTALAGLKPKTPERLHARGEAAERGQTRDTEETKRWRRPRPKRRTAARRRERSDSYTAEEGDEEKGKKTGPENGAKARKKGDQ